MGACKKKGTSCATFHGRKGQPHDGKYCRRAGPNKCPRRR